MTGYDMTPCVDVVSMIASNVNIPCPSGDNARFRQDVETMYKDMWRNYCLGDDWPPNTPPL